MQRISRRQFSQQAARATAATAFLPGLTAHGDATYPRADQALITITLDLEMSRHYPTRGTLHWDYEKGNLDTDTKRYSREAARRVKDLGGIIHFFCVGRVLEQENIEWLEEITETGHPVGNHTYDHVNVHAKQAEQLQFRFQRAPWLIRGKTPAEVIEHNIAMASWAMQQRLGIEPAGFRTPGGFYRGIEDRPDLQQMLMRLVFDWVSRRYPRFQTAVKTQRPDEAVFQTIIESQTRAQPYTYPTGLIEVPMSPISDVNAMRSLRWTTEAFLEAVDRAVLWAIENRAVFDFLAHPSCLVVTDPTFRVIERICKRVQEAGDRAALVSLDALARRAQDAA